MPQYLHAYVVRQFGGQAHKLMPMNILSTLALGLLAASGIACGQPLTLLCSGNLNITLPDGTRNPTVEIPLSIDLSRKTVQTVVPGEGKFVGDLLASELSFTSYAKARMYADRGVENVAITVDRTTGSASIMYVGADKIAIHLIFTGSCERSLKKF